ncbi:UNVERIFIED_CONTAM: adenine-specific DNA-methyltransferase [Brevibacillus sp. OAP136]
MDPLTRLELIWPGKRSNHSAAFPRLTADASRSYHSPHSEHRTASYDNHLIFGENLLALQSLKEQYEERFTCIYIDPPYNTGQVFDQYDDGLDHGSWLSFMKERLHLFHQLLKEDGTLWISIDDDESHYLKVVCDEIFGRHNFVSNIVWIKKSSPSNDARWISDTHDHILVYAKDKALWRPNKLPRTQEQNKIYKHSDEYDGVDDQGVFYGRGPWFPGDMTVKTISESALYPISTPSGRQVRPAAGRAWVYTEERFRELVADHRITFGKSGNNKPCIKRFLTEIEEKGVVPRSVWHYSEVGENRNARQEVKKLNAINPFATPKPEKLIKRILEIATKEGDYVLDAFAGSGTTGAVAHKMRRSWVMIERGEHCHTHIWTRMKKVIDGEDHGGITKEVAWTGGGGFSYHAVQETS